MAQASPQCLLASAIRKLYANIRSDRRYVVGDADDVDARRRESTIRRQPSELAEQQRQQHVPGGEVGQVSSGNSACCTS